MANEGSLQALASFRPGRLPGLGGGGSPGRCRRLGEALKEMAVKLMVVQGKERR
ncbi:MAG TPA: hypothetical protein VGR26_08135 [Acidimicrobiales bacterium]|nr:hypothetical protein [Acidimicrobiales bacterium]